MLGDARYQIMLQNWWNILIIICQAPRWSNKWWLQSWSQPGQTASNGYELKNGYGLAQNRGPNQAASTRSTSSLHVVPTGLATFARPKPRP